MRGETLLCAGAMLASMALGQARAADQVPAGPNDRQVLKPGKVVNGTVDFAQDVDWTRLIVKPGQNYIAGMSIDAAIGEIDIYDAKRKLVARQTDFNGPPFGGSILVQFIAPTAPLYLAYTLKPSHGTRYPARYTAGLFDSCAHNKATRCTAPIGKQTALDVQYGGEGAWYRVTLQAGRTYTLGGAYNAAFACDFDEPGQTVLGLADASGKAVVKPRPVKIAYGDGDKQCNNPQDKAQPELSVFSYKPTRTGTYYVTLQANDGYSRDGGSVFFTLKAK